MNILHSSLFFLAAYFLAAYFLAVLLTPGVIHLAKKLNLEDLVNDRSAHNAPTPRGGGLIFIFPFAILYVVNTIFSIHVFSLAVTSIVVLSFFCSVLGFLDDKYSLPSWLRLFFQVVLVSYPAFHLPLMFSTLPAIPQYTLYIISWVWFINLFNFMDGTDGYAAQEAIFILFFIAYVSSSLMALAIFLIGSILGFLRSNYPRALIFMGDSGSYFLGYLLFGFMLYSSTINSRLIFPFMIVSLLFTADATYTLIKRMLKKQPFFSAHRHHWYQRLYNLGSTHFAIFWFGVLMNLILFFLAIISLERSIAISIFFIALSIIFIPALLICNREKKSELYDS